MITTFLELTCRDPVIARDGRPFGYEQGNRMRPVDWPLPSVVAGSLRSALGKAGGQTFSEIAARELLQVGAAGAFPLSDGQLYLPAPQDCVLHPGKGPLRVAPQTIEHGSCDWPEDGLMPVMLSEGQAQEDFKPGARPAWWPLDRYAAWLGGTTIRFDRTFLLAAMKEERTHVRLHPQTGAAEEGILFTTVGLPLTHLQRHGARPCDPFTDRFAAIRLSARVRATGWCSETAVRLEALHPLGGERRLVHWRSSATNLWACPETVADALAGARRVRQVRMVLATPAIFRDGWKPGWLNGNLTGTPPGSGITLKLVGVCMGRWQAVSGWSLLHLRDQTRDQPRGPKPVRRMVPAGGVYFFEVESGASADLAARWLESVCDDDQDARDGFGLAAWGTW